MPYSVKTNVFSDRCEIYIAARTNDSTAVTIPTLAVVDAGGDATWKPVGTYKGGGAKLSVDANGYEDHAGGMNPLGSNVKLEVPAVETDTTKLTTLEGFTGKFVDVVMRKIGATKYYRFNKLSLMIGAEFPFDQKNPNNLKLELTGIAEKLSDVYSTGTLS